MFCSVKYAHYELYISFCRTKQNLPSRRKPEKEHFLRSRITEMEMSTHVETVSHETVIIDFLFLRCPSNLVQNFENTVYINILGVTSDSLNFWQAS